MYMTRCASPRKRLRTAFVSSCLPRKCGIATFTDSLSRALEMIQGKETSFFVAMNNNQLYDYPPAVICEIERDNPADYRRAAEAINASAADVVSLQHEFGLFGGPDGIGITDFLRHVQKPVVTTLHTVLPEPAPGQRRALLEVAALSGSLVVMNETAVKIITENYGIPREKIRLIPHGVPDTFFIDPLFYKHQLGLVGRFVILTFGFLSPNKGIEVMLKALTGIIVKHPRTLYIVLGITHPEVKKHHGEVYLDSLRDQAGRDGITDHVLFVNEFVDNDTLIRYLGAADLVVCPYHSEAQITSGVLSNALGMGKAIVSTPYLHAREVLDGGRGVLVGFKDAQGMSEAVLRLIENPRERLDLAARAYLLARQTGWTQVGRQYLDVFEDTAAQALKATAVRGFLPTLPAVNFSYLKKLSDETGIVQHTLYGIPDYSYNYSADDAARAMAACAYYLTLFRDESVLELVDRYLAFLAHARQENGWFYNYMNYRKGFPRQEISQDTFGRCLWGLGAVAGFVSNRDQGLLAAELLEAGLPVLDRLSYTRGLAYSACGLDAYLRQYPRSEAARNGLRLIAGRLLKSYRENASASWQWFEDFLTYDNARLPQALLLAYRHLSEPVYLETALKALDFLIGVQYHDGYFDLVGNQGWYVKGGERALFCQQPVDAGSLAETCLLAGMLSGQPGYLDMALAALQWYLGRNRLGTPLYYPDTGACSDGLTAAGPSKNMGAESTISFLLALVELYRFERGGSFRYS
jgi:glycosyltransferase involved in cell wall biosynthesis